MSKDHRDAEELSRARANARQELVKRSKPWAGFRGGQFQAMVTYPSLAARMSLAALEEAKPCPCEHPSCTAKKIEES